VPERVQAVAAVGTGLVAADGIAQRGPRGVGTYRCRPVAEDTGEKARLGDGLPAVEAVGGPLRDGQADRVSRAATTASRLTASASWSASAVAVAENPAGIILAMSG